MLRKTSVAAAVIAFAAAGSALFGGAALADGADDLFNTAGAGGAGGSAANDCNQVNVLSGLQVLSGLGLLGVGEASNSIGQACVADAPGGAGGAANADY